jgi:hypothetical protein
MNAVIAKSTGLLSALAVLPRATVRRLIRVSEAFVDAIERHALGK